MTAELSDDDKWAALVARDAGFDGRFIVGVLTTGVYCRPGCAARTPLRRNVRFFDDAAAARDAGLRACKRCRPDDTPPAAEVARRLEALARHIDAHADETLPLAALARRAGLSAGHLQRRFTALFGVSPRDYQAARRLDRLKASLKAGDDVAGAIFEAGYGSTSRVYEQVDGRLGMTPSAYRAGGAGEAIGYTTLGSALGPLLMAATARGVCFVRFGESPEALVRELADEYPAATITPAPSSSELAAWLAALDDWLRRTGPRPELPLDLRGTAFQLKVWRFLMGTREGEVLSYGELAAGIGQPKAVRAAASACAANRIALLVPCHRVLRGDGSLGGYRWGKDRKRSLIDAERRAR